MDSQNQFRIESDFEWGKIKRTTFEAIYKMVGGNGLEPMTSAMSTQCSNQLS